MNNLKQLGLATANYESAHGVLPPGNLPQRDQAKPNEFGRGAGVFCLLLPQMEQMTIANAYNYSLSALSASNVTVAGIGLAVLQCPSDPSGTAPSDLSGLYPYRPDGLQQQHASYSGNRGQFSAPVVGNGLKFTETMCITKWRSAMTGVIYDGSRTRLAEITDGASNTLLFGERTWGILDPGTRSEYAKWQVGDTFDTTFDTFYLINGYKKYPFGSISADSRLGGGWWVPLTSASSYHSGGANFAMVDGSVRFLKEGIDTWTNDITRDGGYPAGVTILNPCFEPYLDTSQPKVYQALSSRRGGEIISADSF